MNLLKKYKISILIFSLALLVRLLFALPHLLTPDLSGQIIAQDGYYEIAENLLQGQGYSRSPGAPYTADSVRTPLFPFFILAILYLTGSYKAVLILQAVVGSFIPLFGKRIATMLFKNRRVAIATGVVLAVEPHSAWLSNMLFTETVFTFFFLAGCVFFLTYLQNQKHNSLAWASLLFALAMLTRPTIHFLLFFFALLILWAGRQDLKRAARNILIMFAVIFAMLLPWLFRNYLVFGKAVLSTQSSLVLYANFVPSIIALDDGISFAEGRKKFWALLGTDSVEEILPGTMNRYDEVMIAEIPKHPVGIVKSLWMTFYTFFTHDGLRSVLAHHGLFPDERAKELTKAKIFQNPMLVFSSPALIAIAVARALWALASLLSFFGLYLFIKEKLKRENTVNALLPAIFMAGTVFYFLAVSAVAGLGIDARFRVPVNAFIIMFAMYFLLRLKRRFFLSWLRHKYSLSSKLSPSSYTGKID